MPNSEGKRPDFLPSWFPQHETIEYLSVFFTAAMLLLVAGYLLVQLFRGKLAHSMATAAGVGVGGAGT